MEEYKFLLDIAIILAMTKSFSLVSKKFNMPPVVGALIAGIILGPVVLNVVSPSDSVLNLAEVGVVVLMFQAGLETDIDELKKCGIPAFVIALCGVLIPLIMGAVLSVIYGNNIMESIFIGVILTATSVSITVEALQDMGHLKGRVGTAILGAAIIDDILGIVLLSIMTSLGGASGFCSRWQQSLRFLLSVELGSRSSLSGFLLIRIQRLNVIEEEFRCLHLHFA